MVDHDAYRVDRDETPAAGPAQTDEDRSSSLQPGAKSEESGTRGDVDRAHPYEHDPSPQRMEPQPLVADDDEDDDPRDLTT